MEENVPARRDDNVCIQIIIFTNVALIVLFKAFYWSQLKQHVRAPSAGLF